MHNRHSKGTEASPDVDTFRMLLLPPQRVHWKATHALGHHCSSEEDCIAYVENL